MKQRTHLLIPLLAISMLAVPLCKGTVVFSDDFSEAPATLIVGKSPDVGNGAWTGTGNGVARQFSELVGYGWKGRFRFLARSPPLWVRGRWLRCSATHSLRLRELSWRVPIPVGAESAYIRDIPPAPREASGCFLAILRPAFGGPTVELAVNGEQTTTRLITRLSPMFTTPEPGH